MKFKFYHFTAVLFFIFCTGCSGDKQQVQIVTKGSDFKTFKGIPRKIVHGPYCVNVTETNAVIGWEETSWDDKPRYISVEMNSLSPATDYTYLVNGASQNGRLVTPPSDTGQFRFLAVGDTQTGPDIASLIAAKMMNTDPSASFFIHLGDMVGGPNMASDWQDDWWSPLSGLLLQFPVFPVMGNHDQGSTYFEGYFKSFRDSGKNYSFDWGQVHFVVLDFNNGIDADDENVTWLQSDLQEHQGAGPIVVCQHIPVYFSDTGDVALPTKMQNILAPIYEQYGVSLVLSGHLHGYQHHLVNGIHYVISAGGGGRLYDYGLPLPGSTLALQKTYNFTDCGVDGQGISCTEYDVDGNTIDAFNITKAPPSAISTQIAVEASAATIAPGGQCTITVRIKNVMDLGRALFTLKVYKDDPAVQPVVQDADPVADGTQIQPGTLGGTVLRNGFDAGSGIITYEEQLSSGVSGDEVTVASILLSIPSDAQNTSLYFVPNFVLHDSSGHTIPHYMGGAKVVIK